MSNILFRAVVYPRKLSQNEVPYYSEHTYCQNFFLSICQKAQTNYNANIVMIFIFNFTFYPTSLIQIYFLCKWIGRLL